MATLAQYFNTASNLDWWKHPPKELEDRVDILQRYEDHINHDSPHGEALRELYRGLRAEAKDIADEAKRENPLAFAVLSWEQTLKCNAWVWGITLVCDFDANRKGKTAGAIFNAQLWLFPNDPEWLIFNEHEDEFGNVYHLIPRPSMEKVLKIQKYLETHPELKGDPRCQPWDEKSGNAAKFGILKNILPDCFKPCFPYPSYRDVKGTIWQGAPDADYHKNIVIPEWNKWVPKYAVKSSSEWDKKMKLVVKYFDPAVRDHKECEWTVIFKSYESKDEKFSGAAVKGIVLTEGLKGPHLNEIKQRFQTDGFGHWDYTPYEARNSGSKTALAHKVYTGKEQLPLRPFVFTGFGISQTPDYILPAEKKKDMIRIWQGKPEGQARLGGNFFTSSPVVLSNLDEALHCIAWTKKELFEKYPDGRIYRAMDPGWDHPTAMVWGLLTKTNTWFIYRMHVEAGLGIAERCEKMISMSGNTRCKVKYGPGEEDYYFEEIHESQDSEVAVATIADFHVFKTDERTKRPYSTHYVKEGLTIVPSTTLTPKHRGQEVNDKLRPDLNRGHPVRRVPPGCKIYFLINEPGIAEAVEKLQNVFWERFSVGDRKGEPKDEVQQHDDDEFDGLGYLVCTPYVWTDRAPARKIAPEMENLKDVQRTAPYRIRDLHRNKKQRRAARYASTGY